MPIRLGACQILVDPAQRSENGRLLPIMPAADAPLANRPYLEKGGGYPLRNL
ncbi:MAG: hypothetical protein F6K36_30370 [Symploca sp. SIO3C6]|nr:hypothetical protein [Symploca sp. SIO3C6]